MIAGARNIWLRVRGTFRRTRSLSWQRSTSRMPACTFTRRTGMVVDINLPHISHRYTFYRNDFLLCYFWYISSGWSIAADERDWKYRLSIYYVKPQDTGIYTCATPKGLTHSVIVNVLSVHCNAAHVASTDPHLLIHVEGTRLGQRILFSCSDGFKLNGLKNATCQASGIHFAVAVSLPFFWGFLFRYLEFRCAAVFTGSVSYIGSAGGFYSEAG